MFAQLHKKSILHPRTRSEPDELSKLRDEASRISQRLERNEISAQEAARQLNALTETDDSILSRIFSV